jgi:hypothetical protein
LEPAIVWRADGSWWWRMIRGVRLALEMLLQDWDWVVEVASSLEEGRGTLTGSSRMKPVLQPNHLYGF